MLREAAIGAAAQQANFMSSYRIYIRTDGHNLRGCFARAKTAFMKLTFGEIGGPPASRSAPSASGTRDPDIRQISVTSRMGSVNFANHIIRENNCYLLKSSRWFDIKQ